MPDHGPNGDIVKRARIFWNGRSQAVRLPKEFRFQGTEVLVRREGEAVVLEPLRGRDWPQGYWKRVDDLRRGLELPEIEPLAVRLLDPSFDRD